MVRLWLNMAAGVPVIAPTLHVGSAWMETGRWGHYPDTYLTLKELF